MAGRNSGGGPRRGNKPPSVASTARRLVEPGAPKSFKAGDKTPGKRNGQDPAGRRGQASKAGDTTPGKPPPRVRKVTRQPVGGDPTARRRRSHDQVVRDSQQIIKRHRRGESMRSIAAALGLGKSTVEAVIKSWRRAQAEAGPDAEQAALLSKLGGGSVPGSRSPQRNGSQDVDDEFDDEDADEWGDVVVDRLSPWERLRWEWDHNEALLRADPENALALYRRGHLPGTRPNTPEDYEGHMERFREFPPLPPGRLIGGIATRVGDSDHPERVGGGQFDGGGRWLQPGRRLFGAKCREAKAARVHRR